MVHLKNIIAQLEFKKLCFLETYDLPICAKGRAWKTFKLASLVASIQTS